MFNELYEELQVGQPYEKLIDDLHELVPEELKDLHKAIILVRDSLPNFWHELGLGNIEKQVLQMYQMKMKRK